MSILIPLKTLFCYSKYSLFGKWQRCCKNL